MCFESWEHFQDHCCRMGLQPPNPQNKESPFLTLSAGKDENCQLPEYHIPPVIPLFFSAGVTLPGPQSKEEGGRACLTLMGKTTRIAHFH